MTGYLTPLYQLLSSPIGFIHAYRQQTPLKLCYLSIFIVSISQLYRSGTLDSSILSHILCLVLFYTLFIAIQSVSIDFFGQIFNLLPQSLRLFSWLGITFLPLALAPALYLLLISEWISPTIFMFCHYLIYGFILVWQVIIVSILYKIPIKKGLLIYLFPLFAILLIFFILLFFFVSSFFL